jgi:hypothetical protein
MEEIVWADFKRLSFPFQTFWFENPEDERFVEATGSLVTCIRERDRTRNVDFWRLVLLNFSTVNGSSPTFSGVCRHFADANGDIMGSWDNVEIAVPSHIGDDLRPALEKWNLTIMGDVLATLMALGCKNVGLEPRDNDEKSARRAAKRFGGNANSYRYHVLTVRPAGSKHGTKGEEIGMMPRHVCRGHFSEYGPEFGKGLLFGKYAGRFYIPPHMKGKKENGTVEKDYQIGWEAA